MTERVAFMLAFVKNMLPFVCEAMGLTVALIFGLLYATQSQAQTQAEDAAAKLPAFEVAYLIKPRSRFWSLIMWRRLLRIDFGVVRIDWKPSSLDQRLWLMVIDHVQKASEN